MLSPKEKLNLEVLVLCVVVLGILFLLISRNNAVFNYRWGLIERFHSPARELILYGPGSTYDDMLWHFWVPLEDKYWINPVKIKREIADENNMEI